jgi:hypothetical protein
MGISEDSAEFRSRSGDVRCDVTTQLGTCSTESIETNEHIFACWSPMGPGVAACPLLRGAKDCTCAFKTCIDVASLE